MRVHAGLFISTVLAIGATGPLTWANTALDIAVVLADPELYQSQIVRVTGVVANHTIRRSRAGRCYQTFTMNDDTGSIRAVHKANCAGAKNALRNRDVVTVEARFQWAPGQSGLLKVQSILIKVAPSAQ